jgi:galactokinase
MVGAGFGGSAIAMMRPEETGRIMEAAANLYEKSAGRMGAFHVVTSGDGAWASPV